jgi:hypothetical protein
MHGKFQRAEKGPESGVNFGLCGNQALKLYQNLPLWEAPAAVALVTLKPPVRITAGKSTVREAQGTPFLEGPVFTVNFPLCGNPSTSHKGAF